MARPSKATVEYFPLVCKFSDSIEALENIYGNDGFVVWVKLLQKLGRSENHYIDLRTNAAWKLFYSIFKIDEFQVKNILDTLADLECIDKKLWEHKIIYSQNFVDGVTDAYRNRKYTPLSYDEILGLIGINDVRNSQEKGVSDVRNPISYVRNPQSKLKETKENKSKEYSLSSNEEKITEDEREILKNYVVKTCKALNPEAYIATLIKSGDYKRILENQKQKGKITATQGNKIKEDYPRVKDMHTAVAFVGKYGDYTDENHPPLVKEVMQRFKIRSYTHAVELQQEERKCQQNKNYNST